MSVPPVGSGPSCRCPAGYSVQRSAQRCCAFYFYTSCSQTEYNTRESTEMPFLSYLDMESRDHEITHFWNAVLISSTAYRYRYHQPQVGDLCIIALLMLRFALRKGCRVRGAVGPPPTREVVTQMVMTQTQTHTHAHTQAWTWACRGYTTTPALHNNNNHNSSSSSSSTTTNNNDNNSAQESSEVPGMLNDGTLDPLTQVGVYAYMCLNVSLLATSFVSLASSSRVVSLHVSYSLTLTLTLSPSMHAPTHLRTLAAARHACS